MMPLTSTSLEQRLPGLAALHAETLGAEGVVVAVLDGQVDLAHPCFAGAAIEVLPSLVAAGGPSYHGTHVMSLLAGQPGSAVEGVAPRCRFLSIPIFADGADGGLKACSQTDLARAISQAVAAGAQVINISGGQLVEDGTATHFLRQAVDLAVAEGVLIVAATGNDGCECLHVPAALEDVLAVGALDVAGQPLPASNWDRSLASHGVMAPGVQLSGAEPGGGVVQRSGTSFAAPLVSGVAALLLSLQLRGQGKMDASAARKAIVSSATPCSGPTESSQCQRLLGGTLNVSAARSLLFGLRPSDVALPFVPAASPVAEGLALIQTTNPFKEEPMPEETPGTWSPSLSESFAPASAGAVTASACACGTAPAERSPEGPAALPAAGPRMPAGVRPSCGGDLNDMMSPFPSGQKVFVLGRLYYDFGSESRRDYFISQFGGTQGAHRIWDPTEMAAYLSGGQRNPDGGLRRTEPDAANGDPGGNLVTNSRDAHDEDANALIWTLYIDQDPVYAIVPSDQFAVLSFSRLESFLVHQARSDAPFRVAVAGTVSGSITLLNGTVVPVLRPQARGLFDWDIDTLVKAVNAVEPGKNAVDTDPELRQFLSRVYFELRNLGVSPQERALNFAATNVRTAKEVFGEAAARGLVLDKIGVKRSPICRRDSDCWDIGLRFFNPKNVFQEARQVFEYTIDVSDTIPVQVGLPRTYSVFSSEG